MALPKPGGVALLLAAFSVACGPAKDEAGQAETLPDAPLATPAAEMASVAPTLASSTEALVARVTASRRIEADASRLALQRATHPLVRQFARTTQREAEASLAAFRRLASAADAPAPTDLDAAARAAIDAVRASDAQSFDAHYLDAVIRARETAIDELERYWEGGADEGLREFAADALPTFRARLQEADTLRQSVNLRAATQR